MSQASICLCIIYMLDLMTASETKPQAWFLKWGLGVAILDNDGDI